MATRHDALFSNGLKNDFKEIEIGGQAVLLCQTEDGGWLVLSRLGPGQICLSDEQRTREDAIADATVYLENH